MKRRKNNLLNVQCHETALTQKSLRIQYMQYLGNTGHFSFMSAFQLRSSRQRHFDICESSTLAAETFEQFLSQLREESSNGMILHFESCEKSCILMFQPLNWSSLQGALSGIVVWVNRDRSHAMNLGQNPNEQIIPIKINCVASSYRYWKSPARKYYSLQESTTLLTNANVDKHKWVVKPQMHFVRLIIINGLSRVYPNSIIMLNWRYPQDENNWLNIMIDPKEMRQRAIEIFLIIVTLLKYFRIWITKRIEPAKRHKYCLADERP